MSAFDNLAVQYFYSGDLFRSKYYNDRMARGKAEAKFSVVRKISAANAIKLIKRFKGNKVGNKMSAPMTKSFKTIGKELHELFSDTVKDYNLEDKISA